jgi:hypothetical protein
MNELLKNNDIIYNYPLNGNNSYYLLNKNQKSIKNLITGYLPNELNLINFWFNFDTRDFDTRQNLFFIGQEQSFAGFIRIYKDTDNILKIFINNLNRVTDIISISPNVLYNITLHFEALHYRIVINSKSLNNAVTKSIVRTIPFGNAVFNNINNRNTNFVPFTIAQRIIFGSTPPVSTPTNFLLFNEQFSTFPSITNPNNNHSFTLLLQNNNMFGFISNINFIK